MLGAVVAAGLAGRTEVQMLVITRREGEEVVIGDPHNPIGVVRIASIKGDRVRIAFDFPRQIDVHRREVANQILADGQDVAPGNGHIEVVLRASDLNGHANGHAAAVPAPAAE